MLPVVVTVSTDVADARATDWLTRSAATLAESVDDVVQVSVRASTPRPSQGTTLVVRLAAVVFVRAPDSVAARSRVARIITDLSTAAYGPGAVVTVGLPGPDVVRRVIARRDPMGAGDQTDLADGANGTDVAGARGVARVTAAGELVDLAASASGHGLPVPAKNLPARASGSPF
ncbi:MAG: hypothetical protein ABI336_09540 [Humibacillus sp.]